LLLLIDSFQQPRRAPSGVTVGYLAQSLNVGRVYPERQPPFAHGRRPVFTLPVTGMHAAALVTGHDRHGARRQAQPSPQLRADRVAAVHGNGPKGAMADARKFGPCGYFTPRQAGCIMERV